jgi:hypothetical protein
MALLASCGMLRVVRRAIAYGYVGGDMVPEVLVLAAAGEDMSDIVSRLPAAVLGTGDCRDPSFEEEVVETDVLGPWLHRQCAFSRAEPLVELHPLLVDSAFVCMSLCPCSLPSTLWSTPTVLKSCTIFGASL